MSSQSELDILVKTLQQRANDGTLTATEEANAIASYHGDPVAAARIAKAVFPDTSMLKLRQGFITEITSIPDDI